MKTALVLQAILLSLALAVGVLLGKGGACPVPLYPPNAGLVGTGV